MALAQHGIGIGQNVKPARDLAERQPGILSRGKLRAEVDAAEGDECSVRRVNSFRHTKNLRFSASVTEKRRLCPERARAVRRIYLNAP